MTFGWTGRVLCVDLSGRVAAVEPLDPEAARLFLGGRGLAGRYLGDRITLAWDDPEMPIALFTGPLVGTGAPTSGRAAIASRSPLTGTVATASVGGGLGTELKRAGLDGVVVTGRSGEWVGLEIADGEVAFRDATALRGAAVGEARARIGGFGSVALVGPAAERGVLFASVIVDGQHAAARGGIGLSFASKRLRYVAVSGTGRARVADRAELGRAREEIFRLVAASQVLMGEHGIAARGTPALYDLMDSRRMMPTDNFSTTRFPKARGMNAAALSRRYSPRRAGCRGCHIRCKKVGPDGVAMPEFETLSHFSALVGNDDLDAAVEANRLCNELGMDTISAAATLACHREITGDDLSGERLVELVGAIGRGEGIGEELGQGSARLAAARGAPDLSMSVKGQELPAYDPRGAYGMALAYATSTRGGCHLRAYPIGHEILRKPVATDRFSFAGKARIVKIAEDAGAAVDSLTACRFVFFAATLEEYARALEAVTGEEFAATDLSRAGERIDYNERMMNAANGFGAADDDLPRRFFERPGTAGPGFEVPPIDRDAFLEARARYYRVRGLDPDGRPTRRRAEELGLKWNVW